MAIFIAACHKKDDSTPTPNPVKPADSGWYHIKKPLDTNFASYFAVFDVGSYWIYADKVGVIKDSIYVDGFSRVTYDTLIDPNGEEIRTEFLKSKEIGQWILEAGVKKNSKNSKYYLPFMTINYQNGGSNEVQLEDSLNNGKEIYNAPNYTLASKRIAGILYSNVLVEPQDGPSDTLYFAKNIGLISKIVWVPQNGNRYLVRYHLNIRNAWKK